MVNWVARSSTPWLVMDRPDGAEAGAGVTFGFGLLHQPTRHLGVAGLFAAWLTTTLSRPVEGATEDRVRSAFYLGQAVSSLALAGDAEAVRSALQRVDLLLGEAAGVDVDENLADRSRAYGNPLEPWSQHLAARWPGHRPHLSALGPLALSTLDGNALGGFVADCVRPAARVYWTNEPALADIPVLPPPSRHGDPTAPPGWREQPGCVIFKNAAELFSVAAPDSAATQMGFSLLLRALHRRMVDFEPLATAVRANAFRAGGNVVLACFDADLLPGKDAAARAATVQTLEDLAAGSLADAEIDRIREMVAGTESGSEPYQVGTMMSMAGRHLVHGDFPTPYGVAGQFERTSNEEVREALAAFLPQLLLSVPVEQAQSEPPFPMAEPVLICPATGRRFASRAVRRRAVLCSQESVGIVELMVSGNRFWSSRRQVTLASVAFDDLVLRVDTGGYSTTLVDNHFLAVQLVWDGYRGGDRLRELVDDRSAGLPVIQQKPDPSAPQRLAAMVRRQRRRVAIGATSAAAAVAALVSLIVYGATHDSPDPVTRTVDMGTTARLGNGTTLSIVDGPELIEHYNASIANVYGVQMRLCAGKVYRDRLSLGEARNYFGAEKFRLGIGEASLEPWNLLRERPAPRGDYVETGECATGWLLFKLPSAELPEAPTLRYTNIDEDRLTWRLPGTARKSPLSKPCPSPTPDLLGRPVDPGWVGCPKVTR